MLGWNISVHRQRNGGANPAEMNADCDDALAIWQTGIRGLEWLDELVVAGKAIDLGGNGYPLWYTARAIDTLPQLIPKPPMARDVWQFDPGDVLTEKWLGKTFLNTHAIIECPAEEWLLIEAWDES